MQEIEQVVMENEIIEKRAFPKLMEFFALPVYQDSDKRKKTTDFSMEFTCTSRRISIEVCLKELTHLFSEKSELHF